MKMARHTFISYTHENSRFVIKLARTLRGSGVEVWLDQWDIPEDADWQRAIERAIRGCERFLIVLSPPAITSWVVREQFLRAKQFDKKIIPVLYQVCSPPPELQDAPMVDFAGQSFEAAVARLFKDHFPDKKTYRASASKLSVRRPGLHWNWPDRLSTLLWPDRVTLGLLLLLLFISTLFFWTAEPDEFSSPFDPALEQLTVIATPTPLPFIRPQDGKPMAYIPAGAFLMGSDESDLMANEDEKPQRSVYLDAFWIDQTETTNGQYRLCVAAGFCTPARNEGRRFARDAYPVVGVNWGQAGDYCRWVGGRLPAEAEWEKAARGTDGRIYPWGNRFDKEGLNYCDSHCIQDWRDWNGDDGYKYTAPVGGYPRGASPYGLLDMSGNVWEWTADWYAPDAYAVGPDRNPTGPASGQQRVVRGGSWNYTGRSLRAAHRHKDSPTFRYDEIGFRCVVDSLE